MVLARDDTSVLGQWWWSIDRYSLFAILILMSIGVILVFSASPPVAKRIDVDDNFFIRKHLMFILPSLLVLLAVSMLHLKYAVRFSLLLLAGAFFALLLTPLLGYEVKGATRWLSVFNFSLQASEFIKPAFAVGCAWVFSAQRTGENIPGYFIGSVMAALIVGLLVMQPDIGQTVILLAIWGVQVFMVGLPFLWVVAIIVLAIAGMSAAYIFLDHVQSRIDRFLNPDSGDTFQIDKSLEAFSSGGIFGRGLGEGVVKHHLPDAHADFIFAVAGEEAGLLACLFIVFLFAFVICRSLIRAMRQHNNFIMLAVAGLSTQIALQALVNISSALHLIPTKGMTLPFISYGGSSLLACCIGAGILLCLTRERTAILS